ncbi:MAG: hypothetical protein N2485_03585 [bacterium]|nr:hypothetical protein [bacterium]
MSKKSIIWSYTKGEFVVFDHYYFSKLYSFLLREYNIYIPTSFEDIFNNNLDILVFNYPEIEFNDFEVQKILELFYQGKTILFLSYYNNEDNSSKICNKVLNKVGLNINYDEVVDEKNNLENDKYLLITSKVGELLKANVSKVFFACSSSISVFDNLLKQKNDIKYIDLLLSEDGVSLVKGAFNNNNGKILAFGSCVFWDNFSLVKFDNFQFVKNIFSFL